MPRLLDFTKLTGMPNLSTLDLTHNLWHCDCAFLPFLDWILEHPTLVNGHVLECNTPPEMETQTVLDVLEMDC